MKRILLSTSLAFALSGVLAFAQTTTPPDSTTTQPAYSGHHHGHFQGHNPQQRAAFLAQRLNLNSDQQTKLEALFTTQNQKMTALKADTSLTQDQKRAQFHTIHQDMHQQLSTILTPEELQQMKSFRHHRFQHGGNYQPSQPPTPPGL